MKDYYTAILQSFPGITKEDFKLRDDGSGIYITEWTFPNAAQPDLKELDGLATELAEQNEIYNLRRQAYPDIGEQLDAILKQLSTLTTKEPELEEILARVEQVKTDNPLPPK